MRRMLFASMVGLSKNVLCWSPAPGGLFAFLMHEFGTATKAKGMLYINSKTI